MDYQAIRDALKQWVRDVTGLQSRWEDEPVGLNLKLPASFVLTGPINVANVGEDVLRFDETGSDDTEVQPTVVGWREFDVMVRCTARTATPGKSAQYQLERLRTALTRPSTREAFDAAAFAVINMSKSQQFDAPFEERFESIASATLRCTAVVDEALDNSPGSDNRDAALPVLTQVELSAEIKGADGSDLPTPLSLEDHVISGE